MDWLKGLQKAIDYMEDHLADEIDYNAVAACACSSSFHFQRIFSLLTGMTMGEYIRNRRLTLAGAELNLTRAKVIDVALKYGYDSPESFAKAFVRFHGIPPSASREPGAKLNSFSRLSLKLIMEGGKMMNYRIESKGAFRVLAKTKEFSTEDTMQLNEIPKFWDECKRDGTVNTLCGALKMEHPVTDTPAVLGLCDGDGCLNSVKYSIAVESTVPAAPEGFQLIDIPAGTWAIFKCVGPMPGAIQDLWRRIYEEFFPQSDYQPAKGIDFELYPEGDTRNPGFECEIWLPVEKKNDK